MNGDASTRAVVALTVVVLLALARGPVAAQTVSEKDRSIVLTHADGQIVQLTSSGLDRDPALSPDGKRVVFVRDTPGRMVSAGVDEVEARELWTVDADGRHATRVVRGGERKPWEDTLAGLSAPTFLSDGRHVVFASVMWVTEGKVNVVDLDTRVVRQVAPGTLEEVVRDGDYKDHLIISQHRYFLPGGSYDWYYLFDVRGRELGPIGPDEDQLRAFRELNVPSSQRHAPE